MRRISVFLAVAVLLAGCGVTEDTRRRVENAELLLARREAQLEQVESSDNVTAEQLRDVRQALEAAQSELIAAKTQEISERADSASGAFQTVLQGLSQGLLAFLGLGSIAGSAVGRQS